MNATKLDIVIEELDFILTNLRSDYTYDPIFKNPHGLERLKDYTSDLKEKLIKLDSILSDPDLIKEQLDIYPNG